MKEQELEQKFFKRAFKLLKIAENFIINCYVQYTIKQAQNDKNK